MAEERMALGKFVWHDLMTTDLARAVAYYTDLFGWTINEAEKEGGGPYKMIHAVGEDHGGFVPLDPAEGQPSHWICYVTVEDVDAACDKAVELGGQVLVPGQDIPGVGRFAVIRDPAGATISPYTPSAWSESYAGPPRPGTFAWHQLLAVDPDGEGRFFSEIFGWSLVPIEMGETGTYHLFRHADGGEDAIGMLPKPASSGPSSWLPYICVENVDAVAARVEPLGGKIWVPPTDIPGVGRFAVTSDPTGAFIAIYR